MNVHGQPSYWLGEPGANCGSLRPGDCEAKEWLPLEATDAAGCVELCDAQMTNGCCRLGPAQTEVSIGQSKEPAPAGCALGHSSRQMTTSSSGAQRSECSGLSFIFFCEIANNWNLAPASAWEAVSAGDCATLQGDVVSYRHTIAASERTGEDSLLSGFSVEWRYLNHPGGYEVTELHIELCCPSKPCSQAAGYGTPSAPAAHVPVEKEPQQGSAAYSTFWIVFAVVLGCAVLSVASILVLRRKPPANRQLSQPPVNGVVTSESGTTVVVGRPVECS